jgi:hypothetical protein
MGAKAGTTRYAVCFNIDPDADRLLRAMLPPGRPGYGALLSELIRKEAERRLSRPQDLERLRQGAGQGGQCADRQGHT